MHYRKSFKAFLLSILIITVISIAYGIITTDFTSPEAIVITKSI